MKYLLLFAVFVSCSVAATVYSYRDADGNLVYTDEPVAGTEAVEVEVAEPMVMPSYSVDDGKTEQAPKEDGTWASWGEESDASEDSVIPTVRIATPIANEAFWTGNGDVTVAVDLAPGLGADQQLVVVLNGQVLARGKDTEWVLNAVDRGSHALQVEVRDADDAVVAESGAITIHVLRPSVINRNSSLMHPGVRETQNPNTAPALNAGS